MHMVLKLAALLALSLLITFLVLVVAGLNRPQKAPSRINAIYTGDVRSLGAEDINRKTLEAAAALRGKQAERFLPQQR
jgi:hypothetical protein